MLRAAHVGCKKVTQRHDDGVHFRTKKLPVILVTIEEAIDAAMLRAFNKADT